jgi:ATP-binding cassette subfamily F protein uup
VQEYEIASILSNLKLDGIDVPISKLSGGQQRRLSLAKALIVNAEFLLLDEPTNHLDQDMIEWLENRLIRYSGTLLMVTHDRYFLERICTRIIELDGGSLYEYPGNYETYVEKKIEREQLKVQNAQKLENLYRKELAWVRAGVQARSTKSKSRLDRFEDLRNSRTKIQNEKLDLDFSASRLGKKTIEWTALSFGWDSSHPLFTGFSGTCLRTDRIGLCGPNGSGKTTLLNILSGILKPDSGKIEYGSTVRIGYFKQEETFSDPDMRAIDYIEETGHVLDLGKEKITASALMERFLFDSDRQYLPVSRLSGGERRRLVLLKVLMTSPNVLLLDEPTNDLDLDTLEVLEDYLDDFGGIVIVISHDRYFLDRICTKTYYLLNGRWQEMPGGYSEYKAGLDALKKAQRETEKKSGQAKTARPNKRRSSLTYQEKKELEALPDQIEKLSADLEQINAQFEKAVNYQEISVLAKQQKDTEEKLAAAEARWLELEEKKEQG